MAVDVLTPVQQLPKEYLPTEGPTKVISGLFEDEHFPATWGQLTKPCDAVAWLRPHELCRAPRLFVDGSSRFDVEGAGSSLLLSAAAAVAERPDLIGEVIPEGQVLFGEGYDGSVRFRFRKFDEWHAVRVDDRLPVDAAGRPAYARCALHNEFWLPLLEKAAAKFLGGYERTKRGNPLEMLTEMTTITEMSTDYKADETFEKMENALENDGLIVCTTDNVRELSCLVSKVFRLQKYLNGKGDLKLVRVRNPLSADEEWTGAWKDGDERWKTINGDTKELLQYTPINDGEFWMEMDDFAVTFSSLKIAMKLPSIFLTMNVVEKRGQGTNEEIRANPEEDPKGDFQRYSNNLQYLLEVKDEKKDSVSYPYNAFIKMVFEDTYIRPPVKTLVFELPGAREKKVQLKELRGLPLVVPAKNNMFEPRTLIPGKKYLFMMAFQEYAKPKFILRLYSPYQILFTELTA